MADRELILELLRNKGPANPTNGAPSPLVIPPREPTVQETLLPATNRVLGATETLAFPPVNRLAPEAVPSREELRAQERAAPVINAPEMTADISTGERASLALRSSPEAKVSFLENIVGKGKVRQNEGGDFEVLIEPGGERAPGAMSKPTWMSVDELGISSKDLADTTGGAIEMLGGLVAALATRGRSLTSPTGLGRWFWNVGVPTAGSQAAGAATDVGITLKDKGTITPEDVSQITDERLQRGAMEAAFGTGIAGLAKLARPFGADIADVRLQLRDAAKYFADKGVAVYEPTAAELTGSSLIGRMEAHVEKSVGGAGPLQGLAEKNLEALRSIQRYMMGESGLSEEEVGYDLVNTVMRRVNQAENAVAVARKTGEQTAASDIITTVGRLTTPERQLYERAVGQGVRERVIALRDAAKARADELFAEVKAQEGGQGRVLDASGLQAKLRGILKDLPGARVTGERESGLLDQFGNASTREVTEDVTLEKSAPSNIVGRIREFVDLENPQMSLQDLQGMRRDIYDDIASGEGVPGLGTRYLSQIGDAITRSIDEEISKIPGGNLKRSLERANEWYKTKVVPFNRQGVTELFKRDDEPGFVGDIGLVNRVVSNPDQWTLIKETLGQNSNEFVRLRRLVADRIIENSTIDGKDLISGDKLINNINAFAKQPGNRELAEDVFGSKEHLNSLVTLGKQLKLFQDKEFSAEQAAEILSNTRVRIREIEAFSRANEVLKREYANKIKRDMADGVLNGNLNPGNFVNRFVLNDGVKLDDLKTVLGQLNEQQLQRVRGKTVEALLNKASPNVAPEDIGRAASGDASRRISASALFNQVSKTSEQERLKAILGEEGFTDFTNYLKLESGKQAKEQAFASAGGISAGFQIQNLLSLGMEKFLPKAAWNNFVSRVLANRQFRTWMGAVESKEMPAFIATMTASAPFIKDVVDEMGEEAGITYLVSIRDATMQAMGQQAEQGRLAQDPLNREIKEQAISREELRKMLRNQ